MMVNVMVTELCSGQESVTDRRTDRQTDGQTDRRTDSGTSAGVELRFAAKN